MQGEGEEKRDSSLIYLIIIFAFRTTSSRVRIISLDPVGVKGICLSQRNTSIEQYIQYTDIVQRMHSKDAISLAAITINDTG